MNLAFDLLKSPWVPCIQSDGTFVELGLRDALVRAHELRELHGESPLVAAALYRLLLAILHRIWGPASRDEWWQLWQTSQWDPGRLDDYLGQWQNRFDLFDAERPFYQSADERVKLKSIANLVFDMASGNNATLFDHHTDAEGLALTPAQAARMLITAQAFGLAGLSGLPQKFTDGPCSRGVLFLVQGDTLFETLALNLVRYPNDAVMPHHPDDCPTWEMRDPFAPDRTVPRGYLDYLTWQNRRILLQPELAGGNGIVVRQMTVAPALRLAPDVLDPMKHYRRDEKHGPLVLRFNEDRALWRDSAALFRLSNPGYRPPQVFDWLAGLVDEGYLEGHQTRRYIALGMANDQAKINFYRSERMPLPLAYLEDERLQENLEDALAMAENAARQLWGAARTLATFHLAPDADTEGARPLASEDLNALTQQWAVERRYWPWLELPFHEMMETLPVAGESALVAWRHTVLRTCWSAFDQVAEALGRAPRTLKASVRARDQLALGLARVLPTLIATS